jgi:hypothetical protein
MEGGNRLIKVDEVVILSCQIVKLSSQPAWAAFNTREIVTQLVTTA